MAFGNLVFWEPGETLEALEDRVIVAALDFCGGDKKKVGEMLGVSHQTIYNRLDAIEARNKRYQQGRKEEQALMDAKCKVARGEMPVRYQDQGNGHSFQGR